MNAAYDPERIFKTIAHDDANAHPGGTTGGTGATVSIAAISASQTEGQSGSKAFTFSVTLSQVLSASATVQYAVAGAGGQPANASDFAGGQLASGTVTFAAGETTKTVTINVAGDTVVESNETFVVTLSSPSSGLSLGTATADGTILNDDGSQGATQGDDVLTGTSGIDTINALGGDDLITGAGGNDIIDGGAGINLANYIGVSNGYSVAFQNGKITVRDRSGAEGTDTLSNIQYLNFSDGYVDTTWFSKTASLSSPQIVDLVELYIAAFNRAPDAYGLAYWGGRLVDGMSLDAIARSFFDQPETKAAYPSNMSTADFVTKVYNNVLGRAPDTPGFNYWLGEFQKGNVQKNNFLLTIINGARAATGSPADAQYLLNKEIVGAHYALTNGLSDTEWAKAVMANVNGNASSVTAANQLSDSYLAVANTSAGAELVIQIIGIAA